MPKFYNTAKIEIADIEVWNFKGINFNRVYYLKIVTEEIKNMSDALVRMN